jgi:hypothetical protein
MELASFADVHEELCKKNQAIEQRVLELITDNTDLEQKLQSQVEVSKSL